MSHNTIRIVLIFLGLIQVPLLVINILASQSDVKRHKWIPRWLSFVAVVINIVGLLTIGLALSYD